MPGIDLAKDLARDTAAKWTDKVKDRLHDAQVALLHQTEDRRALYSDQPPPTEERRAGRRASMAVVPSVEVKTLDCHKPVVFQRPRANSESDAIAPKSRWQKTTRPRRPSFMDMAGILADKVGFSSETDAREARQPFKRLVSNVEESMAYMGIDWYQMQERQKRLSWLFFIENLYFWCYAGYIVTAILVGAVLIWALEPNGQLSFAQSVYSAAACVSQSGLAVTDWSKQAPSTYVISFLLIISGSASLMHMAPVFLRRLNFRMQTRMLQKMEERLHFPSVEVPTPTGVTPAGAMSRFRRTNSDPGIFPEIKPDFEAIAEEPSRSRGSRKTIAVGEDVQAQKKDDLLASSNSDLESCRSTSSQLNGNANGHVAVAPSASPDALGRRRSAVAALGENWRRRGSAVAALGAPNPGPEQAVARRSSISFGILTSPDTGKKHGCSDKLSEMHRLEYKALGKVLKIMIGYWVTVHITGWLIFYAYFEFGSGKIQDKFREEGLRSWSHAAYLTVSSFQNNGLVMTPSSVMDFRWSPLLLNTIGALILLGNTCLPIAVRAIAWWLARRAEPGSEQQRVLDFLLEHPRRCFTHMFPAVHTLWLLLVVGALIFAQTAVMMWQDSEGNAFKWRDDGTNVEHQLSFMDRVWNSLFQAISTRTAGINSVNVAELSQGTTFLMVVMMYFSTTPTVVTMRHSAAELDITGRAEGVDEEVLLGDNSLKTQARRYLTQDITYLVLTLFFICVFEQKQFARSAKEITPDSDGIYGDFSFFKVLFELVSAYGTCGFSLGYRNQTSSFSGIWSAPSQYLLVVVMVLGRLRGLPDSIDPSVKIAMRHGEHREHKFIHT